MVIDHGQHGVATDIDRQMPPGNRDKSSFPHSERYPSIIVKPAERRP